MLETNAVINMSPWISVIGSIIGWGGFIIVVSMFKEFLSKGFSWALGEFLLNTCNQEKAEKLTRWFGNQDEVLACLNEIKEKAQIKGKE